MGRSKSLCNACYRGCGIRVSGRSCVPLSCPAWRVLCLEDHERAQTALTSPPPCPRQFSLAKTTFGSFELTRRPDPVLFRTVRLPSGCLPNRERTRSVTQTATFCG